MRRFPRALVALAIAASAAVAAALAAPASAQLRGPVVEGTLQFAGLSEPVEVLRDANGIPYVFAKNMPDLIRAEAFVTAQARLFQLEAYRAIASGRLAEAIGAGGLASDREVRTLGIPYNARRHARQLSPQARNLLAWYAEGLNAYVVGHVADHPVELGLAGFRASPWTVEDLLVLLHFANWGQAANFKAELLMQQLIDRLGPQRGAELFPVNVNPDRKRPVASSDAAPDAAPAELRQATWLGVDRIGPLAALETAAPMAPIAVGSNNWAIAPARSAGGAAVLANDPHLDARVLPGLWFPIGLFSPEVSAVGATLPGVPGLFAGRNAHVAFGITNAYGDSQDLFIEQVAPGRPDHYVDGDQVRPFEVVEEILRVKDAQAAGGVREEKLTVRRTVRGPIVSDKPLGAQGDRLLSLRTASGEAPGADLGFDRLLVARSAAEVDQAVQQMGLMYFNFVFADKAGAIGHRSTGRVPIRRSGQGIFPKPVTREDDWVGYIAPDRMPGQMSPARGWVATANHDNRPDGYPYDYSSYFSPSYRYERIAQVLEAGRVMTTADHHRLMTDPTNLQVPRLKPVLVAALKTVPEQADLASILEAWDGVDRAELAAPLIYHRLYQQVAYETFVDDLGPELALAYLRQWYVWQERFDRLVTTPDSPWFDDMRTPQVETLPDVVRRAATRVRADLEAQHGRDPQSWRWGAEHRLAFDSPLRRTGFGRDFLGRAPAPMDGSGETVMRARTSFMKGFDVEFFSSMRLVADLADDQKITAVVTGGVVERHFHPHQKNQLDAWFAGELLPWWFDPRAIEANAVARQTLIPATAPR